VSATKILWGQVTTVFLIVLATMWTATEWTAWHLGFQPELGRLASGWQSGFSHASRSASHELRQGAKPASASWHSNMRTADHITSHSARVPYVEVTLANRAHVS
jgi:type IV secretory pathway TraG/TraD family ATPase VirD4